MRLIVNADDLGYSRGVNYGIADAHINGIVTSSTAMANMPGFAHAMALMRALPGLGVGLHFNITTGRPLSENPASLIGRDGTFRGADFIFGAPEEIDPRDVERELSAQMDALVKNGCRPTHIDSHHHAHRVPAVMDAVMDCAAHMGIPVRSVADMWPGAAGAAGPVALCIDFHAGNAREDWLCAYLESRGEDVLELMTHPGFADAALVTGSTYGLARVREHAVLTSADVKAAVNRLGIALIRYDEI